MVDPVSFLIQVGVRATFFINSDNLHVDDPAEVCTSHMCEYMIITSVVRLQGIRSR